MKRIIDNPYRRGPPSKRSPAVSVVVNSNSTGSAPLKKRKIDEATVDVDAEFERELALLPIPSVTPSPATRLLPPSIGVMVPGTALPSAAGTTTRHHDDVPSSPCPFTDHSPPGGPFPHVSADSACTTIGVYRVFLHGQQCTLCGVFVAGQTRFALVRHIQKCASVKATAVRKKTNWSEAQRKIEITRKTLTVESSSVRSVERLWCSGCDRHFAHCNSFLNHKNRANGRCTLPPQTRRYGMLPSGHFIPEIRNKQRSPTDAILSRRHLPTTLTYDEVSAKLAPFVPADEKVDSYVSLFFPLVHGRADLEFQAVIAPLVNLWKTPPPSSQESATLSEVLEAANTTAVEALSVHSLQWKRIQFAVRIPTKGQTMSSR